MVDSGRLSLRAILLDFGTASLIRTFLVIVVLQLSSRQRSKLGLGHLSGEEKEVNIVGCVVAGIEFEGQAKILFHLFQRLVHLIWTKRILLNRTIMKPALESQ